MIRYRGAIVWILRLLVGATFIFSGCTKVIDVWGFIYKIEDYLSVWGIDVFTRETLLSAALGLSIAEFTAGVLLLTGCMRRAVVWIMLAMMAVMLPLTAYVWIANPVTDCGCFGEALIIPNWATFLKNVALTAALIYLCRYNASVAGLYRFIVQWLVVAACVAYCLVVGYIGYMIQPIVDFRPYPVGTDLVDDLDDEGEGELLMIYEKDGERRQFTLADLPDSTWTFVERIVPDRGTDRNLAVFDGEEEITADLIEPDGEQVLLLVPNPDYHNRARASMANRINGYMTERGGSMAAIVAASGDALDSWIELAHPDYPVYSAEDTSLKELARGDASIVYLRDGKIQWKRNLYSLAGDFPDGEADFEDIAVEDSGSYMLYLTGALVFVLIVIFGLSKATMIRRNKTKIS